nr:DOG1 [Paeonia lactiflora]
MATNENQSRFCSYHPNWMTQQNQDLKELFHAFTTDPTNSDNLQRLIQNNIAHYKQYTETRAHLIQHDAPSFFCPSWCNSFVKSYLWIGGCRPSIFIRLVYSLCGPELEAQLTEYLNGERKGDLHTEYLNGERKGNLGDITAAQLNLIACLRSKTIKEEDKISSRLTTLHENVADYPLVMLANKSRCIGEPSEEVDQALDSHSLALARILVDADKLRLSTLKELIDILTPLQAVDMLVASKNLHISLSEWGKHRDLTMGENK